MYIINAESEYMLEFVPLLLIVNFTVFSLVLKLGSLTNVVSLCRYHVFQATVKKPKQVKFFKS